MGERHDSQSSREEEEFFDEINLGGGCDRWNQSTTQNQSGGDGVVVRYGRGEEFVGEVDDRHRAVEACCTGDDSEQPSGVALDVTRQKENQGERRSRQEVRDEAGADDADDEGNDEGGATEATTGGGGRARQGRSRSRGRGKDGGLRNDGGRRSLGGDQLGEGLELGQSARENSALDVELAETVNGRTNRRGETETLTTSPCSDATDDWA